MKVVEQDRNPVYQLYRKDQLNRLKKKLSQIKNRKPVFTQTTNYVLPRIPHNRTLSPQKLNSILIQNQRLNNKIIQNMITLRRSGLEVLKQSDIRKVYKSSFSKIKTKTSRISNFQDIKDDNKQNTNRNAIYYHQKQKMHKKKIKRAQKSEHIVYKFNKADQIMRKTLNDNNS